VSEKASLQDQFSERKCTGWAGIEKQRRNDSRRMHNERAHRNEKIRDTEFRVISYPISCFRKNDSAQDFATLHLRGLFLLFRRFGMEGALGLRLVDFRCDSRECTMIRDRDPGTDRDCGNQGTRTCSHTDSIADVT
jgi:hypothetical protein